jgi:hypothetical protein
MRSAARGSWIVRLAAFAVLAVGLVATTAWATTSTGRQNPQLRVVAAVTPTQAHAGDTIVARATVTNTTKRTLMVSWGLTFDTPTGGMGMQTSSLPLKPGATLRQVFRRAVTARSPKGTYSLSVHARDHAGRSHAAAHAIAS